MAKLDQININGVIHGIVPEIAPLFDTSTAYAIGDYVIKDATMYRFKTAHTAGEWNASQVDEVTVGSEIKDIKQATSEIDELKADLDKLIEYTDYDLVNASVKDGIISSTSGNWVRKTGNYTYFIPVNGAYGKVKVTANDENVAVVAILTSDITTDGTLPKYATGCKREFISAGMTNEYDIPSDAKYISIMKTASNVDYTPRYVALGKAVYATKNELATLRDDVDSYLFENETADLSTATVKTGLISSGTGNWVIGATAQGYSSYFIPLSGSEKEVTVTANNSQVSVIALLTTDAMVANTPPSYATGCKREVIPTGQGKNFEVPKDAKYLTVLYTATGNDYTPASVIFKNTIYATEDKLKALETEVSKTRNGITHEKPNSDGELNVVRRCRQLTDIKWTPAFDIPRISQLDKYTGGANDPYYFEDVFKAGVEYTGIPYGQANKNTKIWGKDSVIGFKLGWEIGFDTFMSCVGNAESVVAKESEYTAAKGVHRASFYATICTALTGYALNLPEYYPTSQQGHAPGMNDLGLVSSINLEDIHLGDMVWNPTHGGIITDKLRNENGEIIAIEISEATTIGNADWNVQGSQYGGVCRRRMWSLTDFAKWGSYHLYRYENIDSTPYNPSPYVDTGDEGNFVRIINFPVMPYMGENFEYVKGYIPTTKILTPAYRENETDKLRVIKDGTPWNANGTTDYYDVSGAFVEVGFDDVGVYEAYLCQVSDGTEIIQTKKCNWTVVEPTTEN